MRVFNKEINAEAIKKEFYYLKYGLDKTVMLNWLLFEVEGVPLKVLDKEHRLPVDWSRHL